MTNIKNESAPEYNVKTVSSDDKIILKALKICQERLTVFGHTFSGPDITKDYLILKLSNLETEHFEVLFLNNQHQLIGAETMFNGTVDSASVYPREVVKRALQLNAVAVILAHNHPSGICTPSEADKTITKKIIDALKLMDIRVLDHVIIGGMDSYSFAEHGLI